MKTSRKDKLIKDKKHDPYYEGRKYPDGVVCPACHALYQGGHWLWSKEVEILTPSSSEQNLCPSCRRIRDNYPAGIVFLQGEYLMRRREEVLNLVNRVVEEQAGKSPLRKVIDREEKEDRVVFQLTDDHMARTLGEAVYRAHKGDLKIKYGDQTRFVRVYWTRDIP